MTLDEALELVRIEVNRSTAKHGTFHSAHEGLGVIYEEFDEFADEVRANDTFAARQEAKQLAAMGIRFMMDVY